MSKKKKNKDISKLRAQVEFLKAQLKTQSRASSWQEEAAASTAAPASAPSQAKEVIAYQLNPTLLRRDLRKTFLLTFFAGLLLAAAYFTQNYWQILSAAALNVLPKG